MKRLEAEGRSNNDQLEDNDLRLLLVRDSESGVPARVDTSEVGLAQILGWWKRLCERNEAALSAFPALSIIDSRYAKDCTYLRF